MQRRWHPDDRRVGQQRAARRVGRRDQRPRRLVRGSSGSGGSGGSSGSSGEVTFRTLTGTATRLTVDQRFLDALQTVGASLTAVEGATTDTANGATTFVFPVTGGNATVGASGDRFSGSVEHRGGLQLSGLGRSAVIDGLVLDGSSDQLTGMVAGRRLPLLPLSTSDAQITTGSGTATITDSAVSLTPDALNELAGQLGLPTLPTLSLGSLSVTLTGS